MDEFESEINVSDDSCSYFTDESDTKTIDCVAPDELLGNVQVAWNLHMLTLMLNLCRKNIQKTVTSNKVYSTPKWTALKEGDTI